MPALNGSLTLSILSNSTLTICPPAFLRSPDIDGLDDVAGLRIDRHRLARALPGHSLGGVDETFAVGLAASLLERLVDEVHAVKRANGEHVRIASESILVA